MTSIYGQVGPCYADQDSAIADACDHADKTDTPCGVWCRDGWYAASETVPDDDDPADTRLADGWELVAVLDPITLVRAMHEAGL